MFRRILVLAVLCLACLPMAVLAEEAAPPRMLLPPPSEVVNGPNEVVIRNPNPYPVAVALRAGKKGVDFILEAEGQGSARIPDGDYQMFLVFGNKPDALFRGEDLSIQGGGMEMRLFKEVEGDYGYPQVKVPAPPPNPINMLPAMKGALEGPRKIEFYNANADTVCVGVRAGENGKNLTLAKDARDTVAVADGTYDVYYVFAAKPTVLFQGASIIVKDEDVKVEVPAMGADSLHQVAKPAPKLEPWQTDIKAFRNEVAHRLEQIPLPGQGQDTNAALARANAVLANMKGLPVAWQITYKEIYGDGRIFFFENVPDLNKSIDSVTTYDSIIIYMSTPAKQSNKAAWRALQPKAVTGIDARLVNFTLGFNFNSKNQIQCWSVKVDVNNAKPVPIEEPEKK